MSETPEHAGNPRHPDHEEWLLELGRANFAAANLTGMAFDLLRVFADKPAEEMYKDPLGELVKKLRAVAVDATPSGMTQWIDELSTATDDRNDLVLALPTEHGLWRRKSNDLNYVRTFYDIRDIEAVTTVLTITRRTGSDLMYDDGGAWVADWYRRERERQGSPPPST